MRALLLSLILLASGFASAAECTPTTTEAIELESGGDVYYVLPECVWVSVGYGIGCPGKSFFSFWIYEESNGIDGLQRDDEVVDDTCGGMIDGDRIVV